MCCNIAAFILKKSNMKKLKIKLAITKKIEKLKVKDMKQVKGGGDRYRISTCDT